MLNLYTLQDLCSVVVFVLVDWVFISFSVACLVVVVVLGWFLIREIFSSAER